MKPSLNNLILLLALEICFLLSSCQVVGPPPTLVSPSPSVTQIVYNLSPSYFIGVSINPIIPVVTGGSATGFNVSPSLPTGLVLDTSTGIVTGTPTGPSQQLSCTFIASNTMTTSVVFNIQEPSFSYPTNTLVVSFTSPTVSLNPTIIPAFGLTSFSVSPLLPSGLSLDTTTGNIFGTTTTPQSSVMYSITGSNTGFGTSVTTINISVIGPPPLPPNFVVVNVDVPEIYGITGQIFNTTGNATCEDAAASIALTVSAGSLTITHPDSFSNTIYWTWTETVTDDSTFSGEVITVTASASTSLGSVSNSTDITLFIADFFPSILVTSNVVYENSTLGYTNSGTYKVGSVSVGTLVANIGVITVGDNFTWSWSLSEAQRNLLSSVWVTYSTGINDNSADIPRIYFYLISSTDTEYTTASLTYSIDLPVTLSSITSFEKQGLVIATGALLDLDISLIQANFSYNIGLRDTIVTFEISNMPPDVASSKLTDVLSYMNNGNYLSYLNSYSFLISTLHSITLSSQPQIQTSVTVVRPHPNPSPTPPPVLEVWKIILAVLSSVIVLLICGLTLFYCYYKRKVKQQNESHFNDGLWKYQDETFEPLISPSGDKDVLYLKHQVSGHTFVIRIIKMNETITSLIQRLSTEYPNTTIIQDWSQLGILFRGKMLSHDITLLEAGVCMGNVLYLISLADLNLGPFNIESILSALAKRSHSNSDVRLEARSVLQKVFNQGVVNSAVTSLLEQEVQITRESFCEPDLIWIPADDTSSKDIFEVGAASAWQRTDIYTLIGPIATDESMPEIQQGLVLPLNYNRETKLMEGVNSIVWQAVCNGRTVVLKGMLPFNSMKGYDNQYAIQDSEYKIPLSLPPHPYVIPILHQFIGSSILIYPWISEDVRALNIEMAKKGKRFIRRYTTYIVTEYYPLTLRKYMKNLKSKGELLGERQLLLFVLQILLAFSHLSDHEISHRDCKDDNIFMTKDGKLVLGDFGCAISCQNKKYQSISDLTSRIGCSFSIAPEVHDAIRIGPEAYEGYSLWSILCKNDVYAVGSMIYTMLGIKYPPPTGSPYSRLDIPDIPNYYSTPCNELFKRLLDYNPAERFSPHEAVVQIQVMLFGPSYHQDISEDLLSVWFMERKLDLIFKICDASSSNNILLGSSLESVNWPLLPSVERTECVRFLQSFENDKLEV